jgi:hypothetical protein
VAEEQGRLMDVDVALNEARELAGDVLDLEGEDTDDAVALAERFKAIDQWLCMGGSLPAAWRSGRDA